MRRLKVVFAILATVALLFTPFCIRGQDTLQTVQIKAAAPALPLAKPIRPAVNAELALSLSNEPSVTSVTSDAASGFGYTYFRVRGMDMTRLAVTLNGLPIADPEDQGFYSSNIPNLSASTRITLTPGATGSVGGVAGLAGQLDLLTPQAFTTPSAANLILGFGSYGTRQNTLTLASGTRGHTAAWVNITQQQSNGFRYGAYEEGKSLIGGVSHLFPNVVLTATGLYGDVRHGAAWLPIQYSQALVDPRTNDLVGLGEHFRQGIAQVQADIAAGPGNRVTVTAMGNWVDGVYDVPNTPTLDIGVDQRWYQTAVAWEHTLGIGTVSTGVLLSRDERTHSSFYKGTTASLYRNTGHKTEQTGWSRLTLNFDGVMIVPELQIRHVGFTYTPSASGGTFDPTSWTFANPKITVLVPLRPTFALRASVAFTQREPSRSDLFAGADDLDSTLAAELRVRPVQQEQLATSELALLYTTPALSVRANVFVMNFYNEITPNGPLGVQGIPLRQNVRRSYRRGIEVDADWRIFAHTHLALTGNLLDASIGQWNDLSTGDTASNVRPLQTPPYTATIAVSQALGRTTVTWTHTEGGPLFLSNTEDPSNRLSPSHLDGVSVDCTLRKATVRLSLYNVFNVFNATGGWASRPEPYVFVTASRTVNVQVILPLR